MSEPKPSPSPFTGEGGARRRKAVGGRGRALARAREMRRNPTEAEAVLWRLLRAKRLAGWKFRQQQQLDHARLGQADVGGDDVLDPSPRTVTDGGRGGLVADVRHRGILRVLGVFHR